MARSYRLGELAEKLGAKVRGDAGRAIHGVAALDRATPAGAILVPPASLARRLPKCEKN